MQVKNTLFNVKPRFLCIFGLKSAIFRNARCKKLSCSYTFSCTVSRFPKIQIPASLRRFVSMRGAELTLFFDMTKSFARKIAKKMHFSHTDVYTLYTLHTLVHNKGGHLTALVVSAESARCPRRFARSCLPSSTDTAAS